MKTGKAYQSPICKVVEVKVSNILCGSIYGSLGSSYYGSNGEAGGDIDYTDIYYYGDF